MKMGKHVSVKSLDIRNSLTKIIAPDVETTFEVSSTKPKCNFSSITISHRTSSSVDLVGLQVRSSY